MVTKILKHLDTCTIINGQIIVSSDFNINLLRQMQITEKYSETLKHYNIIQHIEKSTRSGTKSIRHISSNLTRVTSQNVLPCDKMSDHNASYVNANIRK